MSKFCLSLKRDFTWQTSVLAGWKRKKSYGLLAKILLKVITNSDSLSENLYEGTKGRCCVIASLWRTFTWCLACFGLLGVNGASLRSGFPELTYVFRLTLIVYGKTGDCQFTTRELKSVGQKERSAKRKNRERKKLAEARFLSRKFRSSLGSSLES